MNKKQLNNEIKVLSELHKSKVGTTFYLFDNGLDIISFLKENYKNIKDYMCYHSGGGIMIYYVVLNNNVYSICDEILDDRGSDTIVYEGFSSLKEFFALEDERECCVDEMDDIVKHFVKIKDGEIERISLVNGKLVSNVDGEFEKPNLDFGWVHRLCYESEWDVFKSGL